MLANRILTAAALLAAFLAALLWLDRASFGVVVAVMIAFGAAEWGRLAGLGGWPSGWYAAACAILFGVLDRLGGPALAPILWAAAAFWIAVVPWWLANGISPGLRPQLLAAGVMALVPAGLALTAMPPRLVLVALGLVWSADTAAYVVGSAIGRHKFAPSISPRKTWEGVAGAVVASLIYAIICTMLVQDLGARARGAIWVPFLAGALLLCAASIVGDLFESALKRQAGAKDSGGLLPGHGGVLDRIDSAAATLPPAFLLMQAIGAM